MNQFLSETQFTQYIKKYAPTTRTNLGIGDDAAVVQHHGKIVITTDSLVENTHFRVSWVTPYYLGRKAALVNLSDLAAMGATPTYALVSLILPKNCLTKKFISELYKGLRVEFKEFKVEIVGGNMSRGDEISITLTLIGELESPPLLRSGAKLGDLLFVTGILGEAAYEIRQLLSKKKARLTFLPEPRVNFAVQVANKRLATACIDISDGLGLDLSRLCEMSKVGVRLYKENIPTKRPLSNALYGGEDYELLFTVPDTRVSDLYELAERIDTPISLIGKIERQQFGLRLENKRGVQTRLSPKGWDHLYRSSLS
jgi:thiamine-monophosphate kinase